jgi:hypothetical protein
VLIGVVISPEKITKFPASLDATSRPLGLLGARLQESGTELARAISREKYKEQIWLLLPYNSAVVLLKSWRRTLRDYSVAVGFWLLLSQSIAWENFVYARHEHLPIPFHTWAVICGVWYVTIGLLTPPMFYLIEAFPVQAANLWKRGTLYVAGYPLFAVTFACLRWALYRPWIPETMGWGPRNMATFFQVLYEMFADELAIYLGIILAGHAYFYFVLSQKQERERLRMEQALTQSELQALKNQMQPHFLFNTLNGIKTLVGSDPPRAQQMLLNLSGLLRRSLRQGDSDLVTLALSRD